MKFKTLNILILLLFVACKSEKNDFYTIDKICKCYQNQSDSNYINKLNHCLDGYFDWLEFKGIAKQDEQLVDLSIELVKSCDKYQTDFNKAQLKDYKTQWSFLSEKLKEITLSKFQNGNATASDRAMLARFEIMDGKLDDALILLNESLKAEPNNKVSLDTRSILFHLKGDLINAIKDCTKSIKLTAESELNKLSKLTLLNLQKELAKH